MHIVIFGGTFDPIHVGHLLTVRAAMEVLGADGVVLVPAGISPHKMGVAAASAADRLAMCRLAVAGDGRFTVSELEVLRGGASYTVDTVEELGRRYGAGVEFTLLMGADQLPRLHSWHRVGELLAWVRVGVLGRAGFAIDLGVKAHVAGVDVGRIQALRTPVVEVSATEIRERVRAGRSIRWMVTEGVGGYIEEKGLYGAKSESLKE